MFSIVIPLFNEEKNITELIDEIYTSLINFTDFEIILIDDASTDSTYEVIKKIKNHNIKIFQNSKNEGQSFSISRGVKEASNNTIITLDGDGQNNPSDILKLLNFYKKNENINLVGGLRLNRKDSFIKIISSKIANYFRSRLLKDDCKDTGCSLKIFDRNIFMEFPYFDGIHRFLPALFKGYGYKTHFINVSHRKRKFGTSKYGTIHRLFNGIKDMRKVYKIIKLKK